jgi:tetratricopeptide (TPR) repeat protein
VVVVVVAAATLALLAYRDEATVGIGVAERVSPVAYFMTQTRVVYTYLRLLFFPVPQSLEYDFPLIRHFGLNVALQLAGVFMIVLFGLSLARADKWRVTGMAVVAFFILLAPTSSFIPSADAAFEHRLYLPMLAFSLFAASLVARLRAPALIAAPILLLCSVLTVGRGRVWASQISLWEDTVLHAPNKARAWFNLGGAYLKSDPDRARVAFTRALSLQPDFPEAYYDLGVIEQDRGNYREAIVLYQRTTEMNPEYWPAWNNLGNSFLALGESARALEAYSRTLNLNPDHWPSQYNMAIVHYTAGRFDKAIPRLRSVLEWSPDFRDARYLLASSLARSGDTAEAEREWKKLGSAPAQPPMPAPISAPTR